MRHRPPLMRTVLLLGGTFIVTSALVLLLFRVDRVVVATGEFEGHSRPVRAPRSGLVAEVWVSAGQQVEAGTPLLRLDSTALVAALTEATARRSGLEAEVSLLADERERLVQTLHPAERSESTHTRERARHLLEGARQKEARYSGLREQGLVTGLEAEEVRLARKVAEIDLAEAGEALEALPERQALALDRLAASERRLARELEELAARSAELERLVSQDTLRAPIDGLVLDARPRELVGGSVEEGDEVLRLAVAGVERFVGLVSDRGRARILPGLPARLRLDGYPWLTHGTLPARVEAVDDRRSPDAGFQVLLSIDQAQAPGPLFEGMRGRARIVTEERVSILSLVFEHLVRAGDP